MAKGDQNRTQNKIDEQQKMGQGYLTGVQQGLGNQAGNYSTNFFGAGAPSYGSTFGYGSTVPHYSFTNESYYPGGKSGSSTGRYTPTYNQNVSQSGTARPRNDSGGTWDQNTFSSTFGTPGTPDELIAMEPRLAEQGIKVLRNAAGVAGKVQLPDGRIVDVINSAGVGGRGFQWLDDGGGGGGFGGGIMGRQLGDYSNIMSQYQNWADTGGFTPEQLQDIRSRSNSPVRAAYSNAQREVERGRSLQGGYSPGFNAATARMAREQGQLASDQSTNTEAMIAELLNRGKQFGMGGMTSMYGATPGLAQTFGNQMLASQAQQLQAAGLQNQLSLGLMGAQMDQSKVPGNWAQAISNIGNMGQAVGNWTGALYPWMG